MKNYLNKIVVNSCLFLLITTSCLSQYRNKVKSGIYDEGQLEVIVNGEKLYGYININEEVNCKIFFWGNLNDSNISIYNPIEKIIYKGYLTYNSNEVIIKSNEMILPCQRIIDLKRGWHFSYTNKSNHVNCSLDFIKSPKSILYFVPNQLTKKKSYLIEDDLILVYEKNGDWLKIKYIKNNKTFFWIKKADIYGID
ncbi:hypothetical protein [Flavobacterium sp.]|uniref:hypothetical protein n=1 Tax=Flavobacterium sp. TaxID=239 RepID=UPI003D6C41C3